MCLGCELLDWLKYCILIRFVCMFPDVECFKLSGTNIAP